MDGHQKKRFKTAITVSFVYNSGMHLKCIDNKAINSIERIKIMTDHLRSKFENLELNAGQGKISAFMSMSLGLLGIFAALCFLFPSVLTTPELRPFYSKHYDVFYYTLLAGIVLAAGFGAYSAIIKQNRYGFYGLCFSLLAVVLGCGLIKAPTLPALPFYAGFDYFVITLIILAAVFIPLEGFFAKNKDQKLLRVGWVTDMKYFMFSHVGIQLFSFLTVMPIQYWITHLPSNPIVPWVQAQPIWLQFIELLIVVDFTTYWLHRAMHEVNFLWRFHAIHHSSEHMDWLASSRLHLVEVIMTRFIATLPIFLLGFHTSAVFAYLVFISFHAIFIHSNVRFHFPYLRWLIATPEFHHWHHSSEKPAIDKNYAAFIPLYDVMFKSVYMPNHLASVYGTVGYKIPNSFVKQFTWPFKRYVNKLKKRFGKDSV